MTEHGGGGHGSGGGGKGLSPLERSAAAPASSTAGPPEPLISPTGNVAIDGLAHIVNRAAEPWQDLPNQTPIQKVATVVNGVLGILNMDAAVDAFNLGIGAVSKIPWPSMPAATLGMPHIGTPHTHLHPPSWVQPAPPIPLPSIGTVAVGGCLSVLIGGMPAARAGDLGLAVTCGTFAPPFEIAVGSSSVFIGGSRAARMTDLTKHCGAALPSEFSAIGAGFAAAVGLLNAASAPSGMAMAMAAAQTAADAAKAALAAMMGTDPGAPPCVGAVMMGNPTVLIGGFPIPPVENFARAFFMKLWKPLADALHSLIGKSLGAGRAANFFHELVCHVTGHPVDVASGRMLTSAVDLKLPGPLPLVLKRNYATSWSDRDGVLGWGWSHSYDQAVWIEPDGTDGATRVVYRADDGREIEFYPADIADRPPWLQPNEHWDRFNRLTLRMVGKAHFEIVSADGVTREFRAVVGRRVTGSMPALSGAATPRWDLARLTLIRDRAGNRISFGYDSAGNLDAIIDSGGREIRLENDRAGHLTRILVPHPTSNGFVEHARYTYSAAGDLLEVYDALGKPFRMAYEGHLLVRETNRNDLSFYFVYEGGGPEARCLRTWGDGGIYARTLTYDTVNHVTISEDSYGNKTTYQMNADNAVVTMTDALGGQTKYVYDSAYHKVSETDAMGLETKWAYDARGNCTKVTRPDGSEVIVEFNDRDQPVFALDPMKGEWQWGYDWQGLPMIRVDPLQRRVRFVWQPDPNAATVAGFGGRPADAPPPPHRLVAVIDPADQRTSLTYDPAGNVIGFRAPNGTENRWKHDRQGACLLATDPKGNQQAREYDARGRVTRVREPDGNVRELTFDADGNVLSARDRQHDVRFAYQGLGRLRSRTEAGTTVEFEYDREERLIGIKNELGHVYRFELGPTGHVVTESGFDGVKRGYERDLAGRVTEVQRPDDRSTAYAYDARGRVIEVKYSDGSAEAYAYRPDGALAQAKNDSGLVSFERDMLGRIVKEVVGDDWVESIYDVLGRRVGLRSSRGLDQRIDRNGMGEVLGIRATTKRGPAPSPEDAGRGLASREVDWEARFQRDSVGWEMERSLPGGISARWERDSLGRPKTHTVWSGDTSTAGWHYTWDNNDRLSKVVDLLRGPTQYDYDALGSLAAATYADGHVDLRLPDAVGNLFRAADRGDRKYNPAGQLLESRNVDGGATRYAYDSEGNLVRKFELDAAEAARTPVANVSDGATADDVLGRVWTYEWNGAGMLSKVVRPDGQDVEFAYDALGRRVWKKFRDATTRWIWDGNLPLHEWVEPGAAGHVEETGSAVTAAVLDELAARRRRAELVARPAQGPPQEVKVRRPAHEAGTADEPITWLFEPETFAPLAKLVGNSRFSIVTDHMRVPRAMYDAAGAEVWSAAIDAYGDLRDVRGDRGACPFRWAGQYEDSETGLYYNRFRYYDPESGQYTSEDPIGVLGGIRYRSYPSDPLRRTDVVGLIGAGLDDPRAGVQSHLGQFDNGSSVFVPQSTLDKGVPKYGQLGRDDGLFVTTPAAADRAEREAGGDRTKLKQLLGIEPDKWNEPIMRVDLPPGSQKGLRMPSGSEEGANTLFKWGGYTSGHMPEAVIDPVPEAEVPTGRCVA